MRRLAPFELHIPKDVAEASVILRRYGDASAVYAGGTELLLSMKQGALRYDHLVDVKGIRELHGIAVLDDGRLRVGAAMTHRDVARSHIVVDRAPVLAAVCGAIANPRVRAAGTIGGNLAFAEPHSDLATLLLALDANLWIAGGDSVRQTSMHGFVLGSYEVSLEPGEVLTHVEIPAPVATSRTEYASFKIHERPSLGLALGLDVRDGEVVESRLAVGCVGPVPIRSATAESLLLGPVHSILTRAKDAIDALAAEVDLTDDDEGSADFKRNLIGVFTRRLAVRLAPA